MVTSFKIVKRKVQGVPQYPRQQGEEKKTKKVTLKQQI